MKKYFTEILICSGFLGFSLTLLLYFNLLDTKSSFHEIIIDQNALVDSFNISRVKTIEPILKKIDSLKNLIALLKQDNESKLQPLKDTAQIKIKIDSLKSNTLQISSDSAYLKLKDLVALSQDTLRKYRSGKLITFSDPEAVSNTVYNGSRNSTYYFEFVTSDTVNKEFPFKKSYSVQVVTSKTNTDFLVKYPAFGLWALSVTTLISVWFIILVLFLAGLYTFKKVIDDNKDKTGISFTRKYTAKYFLVSLLLVLVFFIIAKITVYDKHNLMPEEMFTNHYMLKFYFLLFIGLIVASVFFGGYLVMGDIMKQCTLKTAELSENPTKNAIAINAICIVYDAANINFKKYFITTALSLTGVVIVTGILFSAINNLDFSKLYYTSFKRPFVSYDIVYLFGGLYSLLILLFYLPLRLTFSDLKEKHPDLVSNPVPAGTPFYKSKDFWNRLKESFTVSTPLLAGLVQLIIDFFTK